MSNELVKYESKTNQLSIKEILDLSKIFISSGRFPNDKDVAQAAVKIIAGAELGLGAFESLSNIYFVNGVRAFSYPLVGKLIKRTGRYRYKIVTATEQKAEIEFFEKIDDKWESLGIVSYTEEDAKNAKLLEKDNWKKYRRDMLIARCLTRGGRWYCGDATDGPAYTKEELEDSVDITVDTNDDLAKITYDAFVEKVKLEVNPTATKEVITNFLKDGGFKWTASSKRDMYTFISEKLKIEQPTTEGEFEVSD